MVTNSVQPLKHFDIHTNYLILRMKNSISFVCCVFPCATHCVFLEGAAHREGERPCTYSLLAVIDWINTQTLSLSLPERRKQKESKVSTKMHPRMKGDTL